MNILVTGGAGYIGSRLVEIAGEDHNIQVLDLVNGGDITSPKSVEDAMVGMDAVIHLAAIVGEDACKVDVSRSFEVNVIGTGIVVNEARRAGVERLVFTSTGNVYGKTNGLAKEKDMVYPLCFYGETKLGGEEIVKEAGYVVVRFGTVCGVSPNMRWDLLPHAIVKSVFDEEEFKIFGEESHRPLTWIDDAVDALLGIISRRPNSALAGKVFNVVTVNKTKFGIADDIMHCFTPDDFWYVTYSDGSTDKRDYQMDGALIERTIGWKPKGDLRKAVQDVMKMLGGTSRC